MSDVFAQVRSRRVFLYLAAWLGLVVGVALVLNGLNLFRQEDPMVATVTGVSLYAFILLFLHREVAAGGGKVMPLFFGERRSRVFVPYLIGLTLLLVGISVSSFVVVYYPLSLVLPGYVEPLLSEPMIVVSRQSSLWIVINILNALVACVVAPIVEELFFHGFLLNRLASKYGQFSGVFVSSVLFSLLHSDILGALLFGIALNILYLRTRSLHASVLVHMLNNGLVFCAGYTDYFLKGKESFTTIADLRNSFGLALAVFLVTVGFTIWRLVKVYPRRVASVRPLLFRDLAGSHE